MYCKNCGAEIEKDAKFCGSCGISQEESEGNKGQHSKGGRGQYFSTSVDIIKNFLKSPITTVKEHNESLTGGDLALLGGILAGIYSLCALIYTKLFSTVVTSILKNKGLKSGDVIGSRAIDIEIDAMKDKLDEVIKLIFKPADVIIYSIIGFVVFIIVIVAVFYISDILILKSGTKISRFVYVAEVSSIPLVVVSIANIILMVVSLKLVAICTLIAIISTVILLYKGSFEVFNSNEDKFLYIFLGIVAIDLIIYLVFQNVIINNFIINKVSEIIPYFSQFIGL